MVNPRRNPFDSKKGKFEKLLYHMTNHLRSVSYSDRDARYATVEQCAKEVTDYIKKLNGYAEEERKKHVAAGTAKGEIGLSNDEWELLPDTIQSKLVTYMMKNLARKEEE